MAKYVNKRFYFEKLSGEDFEEIALEVGQVVDTGITDALYIWDHVYFNKDKVNALCDFHMTVRKKTPEETNILIHKYWWLFIRARLEQADRLSLGLWDTQCEIISYISKTFEHTCENFDNGQVYLTLQVSPELIGFLEDHSFYDSKKIKWFDFTLYQIAEGKMKYLLNSTHSGNDNCIYGMHEAEVEDMLSKLDGSALQVNILPINY